MSMQEPANHYRLGLKLGTNCDNASRAPRRLGAPPSLKNTEKVIPDGFRPEICIKSTFGRGSAPHPSPRFLPLDAFSVSISAHTEWGPVIMVSRLPGSRCGSRRAWYYLRLLLRFRIRCRLHMLYTFSAVRGVRGCSFQWHDPFVQAVCGNLQRMGTDRSQAVHR